jgi:hypothetical protein
MMPDVSAMISGSSLLALAAGEWHRSFRSHDSLENVRVCPGQHVANRSIFINTALILWAFRLSENPAAKIDTRAFSDTATVHAAPFEVCLEKRIDENLIRELCGPDE